MRKDAHIPLFELEDAGGVPRGTVPVWQRLDVIVALVHPKGCEACEAALRLLAAEARAQHLTDTELLAVSMGAPPEGVGLPVVEDPDGAVTRQLCEAAGLPEGTAGFWVADRFTRLYATEPIHPDPPEEVVARALSWLEYLQSKCEECATPVDWV